MKHYKHLFFDLDRTLWDFDKNSLETFHDMYNKYELERRGIPGFDKFMGTYRSINAYFWSLYRKGKIEKEALSEGRFIKTLEAFYINSEELGKALAEDYIKISPTKKHLFPGTHEVLEALQPHYTMHIITNGFSEVQYRKLELSGLAQYFNTVVTSEDAGAKKPDSKIFDFALQQAGAVKKESIMIGDDIASDIEGAQKAGMDQIFVNYLQKNRKKGMTFTVHSMYELRDLLLNN